MKKTSAIVVSVGMGALLVAFQNCSNQTGFTSTGEIVAKSAVDTTGSTDTGAITNPDPTPAPVAGGGSTTGGHTGGDDDHDSGHGHGHGNHTHPGSGTPCTNSSHTAANSPTALNYVCVLRGDGKSERIGLTGATLAGQVGTPRDVCMSQNACLKILATKFEVRSAEPRGFCSTLSAHVVSMTDLEIQSALAQAELNKTMAASH